MNKMVREHQHLGIMHETYSAPYGYWENVYANFRPFGFGKSNTVDSGRWLSISNINKHKQNT